MKPVIEVSDISKSYRISHQEKASYNTIKDDFGRLVKKPFGHAGADKVETFWALKDISFQVNKGEVFGIVGKNGSGKSTLLKILSRIVDPTSGMIKIHGKVASLLEVGTGFHPELTGRENIYFNGSMIGMSKQEITRKFDEIVDFSGVEKFLDTPVKFYSSGMYVRLAFSVAAHLESEILIIDEVLSVGDAQFQKKSLAKMTSIAKEGRTILFVSHSMSSVQELCDKALMLENGKIKFIGETEFVTDKYLDKNLHLAATTTFVADSERDDAASANTEAGKKSSKKKARLLKIELQNKEGEKIDALNIDQDFQLYIKYRIEESCENTLVSVEVLNSADVPVYSTTDSDTFKSLGVKEPGTYEAHVSFDTFHFVPGSFYIRTAIQSPSVTVHDQHEGLPLRIRMGRKDIRNTYFKGKHIGYIADKSNWEVIKK